MIPTKKQVLEYNRLNKKILIFAETVLLYLDELSDTHSEVIEIFLYEGNQLGILCGSNWYDEVFLPIDNLKNWKKHIQNIVKQDKETQEKINKEKEESYKKDRYSRYLELKKEFESE